MIIETMPRGPGKLSPPQTRDGPTFAIVVGAALALLLGGCGATAPRRPEAASASQIRAFVADAKRGFEGRLTLTYDVTIRYGPRATRRIVVNAAQRSADLFSYRTTPSLDLVRQGGPPASYGYAVFVSPGAKTTPGAGIYSCRKPRPSSRWSCEGPYTGIGMGETFQLIGPYPPQALLLGLENAIAVYAGPPSLAPGRHEPAFLVARRASGQALRCLEFGAAGHPVGSVCLRHSGLIASYELAESVTSGVYATATLRSYSPRVPNAAVALPAKPESFQGD